MPRSSRLTSSPLHRGRLRFWALAALLGAPASIGPAAFASEILKPTFSGAAFEGAAGSYSLLATAGEAGIVGETAGGSYRLSLGFWGSHAPAAATDTPVGPIVPFANGLHQNTPNPFRGNTAISFSVAVRTPARLEIYDVMGRRVRTLLHDVADPGHHVLHWNGRDDARRPVNSGVYFYRLSVGDWSDSRKMLRLR